LRENKRWEEDGVLTRTILLRMADSKRMESFVRNNGWTARTARRFVAGERLEEVNEPARALNALGITASFDYLGESVTTADEVAVMVDTYLRLFRHIRTESLDANISLKLTALGLDIDAELCHRNMVRLLQAAGPDMFVRIDMEGSPCTERTLELFRRLWEGPETFRNVGVVIQAYLHRSEADVARLIEMGARVRLCKGAYREPSEIAFQSRAEVDASYLRLLEPLLLRGCYPAIATHDLRMIDAAKSIAERHSIDRDRFEFQMLFGVRRDAQERLAAEGYRIRVYTPFGDRWYPYFMRRLAERPANLWFALRGVAGR
jgi:proline dehydrogenase